MKNKVITILLALALAVAPVTGCILNPCQFKPMVKAASAKIAVVMSDFSIIWPILQKSVEDAVGLKLPDADKFAARAAAIKDKMDKVLDIACPDGTDVQAAQDAADEAEVLNVQVQVAIAKYKSVHGIK